jgi:NADH:ubiquinone reductase (H+-translocating)
MASTRPKVVIVGGGFGGLACARKLDGKDVDVLLIDRENYFTFSPLLYEVATALLNPTDIAFPLRKMFRTSRNIRFQQSLVTHIDPDARTIATSDGDTIAADYLVLASGASTHWFGDHDLATSTLPLKTLGNAIRLRNHVLACLERASQSTSAEERRRFLTFLVVGGGATGVEYAGALAELLDIVMGRDYPELHRSLGRVVLVEFAPRLLIAFPEKLGGYAGETLSKRRVEVRTGVRLVSHSGTTATLSDGEDLETATVVWAAGVKAAAPDDDHALPYTDRSRRVETVGQLAIAGADRVFAIGDVAAVASGEGGSELPMLSPPAMQAGRHVAAAILADSGLAHAKHPGPFVYHDKGTMATVGRNAAVAKAGRIELSGFPAWLAWGLVHLTYLVGSRNRALVFGTWTYSYLRRDRPIRVLARADADDFSNALAADPVREEQLFGPDS